MSLVPPVSPKTARPHPLVASAFWLYFTMALIGTWPRAYALAIVAGPSFTSATNAPLGGVLHLSTDSPSRVTVSVNDGTNTWQRQFFEFATDHSIPLFGFKPARTNQITVTVYDPNRNGVAVPQPVTFVTAPLPADLPNITLRKADPARMEPGYTLFRTAVHNTNSTYVVIVDKAGEVVWYGRTPSTADVRQLPNGDLFMPAAKSFVEMNLLGEIVHSWAVPNSLPIDLHEGVPTDHGTILFLADAAETVTAFPTSVTIPNAPVQDAKVFYQTVVELAMTNSAVLQTWKPLDILDPRRVSYLVTLGVPGWDAEHANAVIEDLSDDSLIVSLRNQNAVIKFSRATGQLRWILGPHEDWGPEWQPYLLTPMGDPFFWQYGQHAPVFTSSGTLLLYDDGNYRAMPFDPTVSNANNYSRAVEYRINEDTMQVSQIWDYGRTNVAERFFTPYEGNADPLPRTGNVLIGFPAVSYVNGVPPSPFGPTATMVRIQEVTHESPAQLVFDLAITMYDKPASVFKDCTIYRCHRIPDLYAHPAMPVGDLVMQLRTGKLFLQFSADDARTYHVQTSADLIDWKEIGVAMEDSEHQGLFEFQGTLSNTTLGQFYRIVTE